MNTFILNEILYEQNKWFLELQLSVCVRHAMRFVVLFHWLVQSSLPFQAVWKDGLLVDVHKVTLSWDYCYFEGGNHKICECATVLLSLPKIVFLVKPLRCLHSCLKVSGFS